MAKKRDYVATIRALEAAIVDQNQLAILAATVPALGWDPEPYEKEEIRLKLRLMNYQRTSLDGELYGDD